MNYKIFIISLICVCFFSSCEKFLSENPDMRVTLDNTSKIRELLTSAYSKGSYVAFTESASDNAEDKGAVASENPTNANPWKFEPVNSTGQDSPTFFWIKSYTAIAAANIAIEAYNNLPLNKQNDPSILGEAYLARAFNHFMLACVFAEMYDPLTAESSLGIPYVTEPGKKVITKYERKTVKYVYDKIEEDLINGLRLIDDSKYKVPKFHFNRNAAYAFATRFYLYKQDYERSVYYAENLLGIDLSSYLRPLNSSSWRELSFDNKRQHFGSVENPSNLLVMEVESYLSRNQPGYRYGLTTELNNELFWTGNVTGGGVYAYLLHGTSVLYNHAKWYEHFVYSGLQSNYGYAYVTHVALTVDEVLLNRAEAYTYLGRYDDAIRDLNQFASKKFYDGAVADTYNPNLYQITTDKIINFYNANNIKSGLISTVLDFRRREFMFEGLRYFDILRYKIPVTHTTLDRTATYFLGPNDPNRAFRMPEEVILSGIINNPY